MKRRSFWPEERSESVQPDQQLQSSQVSKYPSAAKLTAAQGPQRATSSTDKDEDLTTQRSLRFIFQPKVSGKFLRMILFTALMAGVSKSKGLFWGVWGGHKRTNSCTKTPLISCVRPQAAGVHGHLSELALSSLWRQASSLSGTHFCFKRNSAWCWCDGDRGAVQSTRRGARCSSGNARH